MRETRTTRDDDRCRDDSDELAYPVRNEPPVIEGRTIRASPAPYRWVCPCKEPPVLLATYDVDGRLNIKVRDRYWHLFGFGHVHAVCPRCGAEHLLDLRALRKQTENAATRTLAG